MSERRSASLTDTTQRGSSQTTNMRYGTTKFPYDTAGNLIRETNGADVTDYRYNKLNQLISKTTPEGAFVYEYDKRGNLIAEKQGGTALYTYEYDASNRMVMGVNVSTDETSEYIYNGLGMRTANIQTTQNVSYGSRNISNSQGSELIGHMDFFALVDRPVNTQKTFTDNFGLTRQSKPAIINREYVVDYTNPYNRDLAVYEEGSYVTSYTYGLGLNGISQIVMNYPNKTEIDIEGQNSYTDLAVEKYAKLYFHQDRLGSTIRMTRENGTTIAWADYDEWGKPRTPIDRDMNMAGVDNAIGFTSYTYDVVLDKFFAQARMYDQNNRRFMASDPIKDGLNWYAYVGNSPIVFIDPLGLDATLDKYMNDNYAGKMTVTFVVEQPVAGSREVMSSGGVGHTFIRLDYGDGTVNYRGFYPNEQMGQKDILQQKAVVGAIVDDSTHMWNIAVVYEISERQAMQIANFINGYSQTYNMTIRNCTTFAVEALQAAGIKAPTQEALWTLPTGTKELVQQATSGLKSESSIDSLISSLVGYSPADAGEDIRAAGIGIKRSDLQEVKNGEDPERLSRNAPKGTSVVRAAPAVPLPRTRRQVSPLPRANVEYRHTTR